MVQPLDLGHAAIGESVSEKRLVASLVLHDGTDGRLPPGVVTSQPIIVLGSYRWCRFAHDERTRVRVNVYVYVFVFMCVSVCMCMCMRLRLCACSCVCVLGGRG